jgi:hypothetical protein
LWIKCFQLSGYASWKQLFNFRAENAGDNEQFQVGDAPFLIFKARHRFPACIPSKQLEPEGEARLRPAFHFA